MHYKTFTLKGQNILEPVSDLVRRHYDDEESYVSEYIGGFLIVYEDYSFLNSNQLMVCIRFDSTESEKGVITIEVIAGGAGRGVLFGDIFGSENRRINDFEDRLANFCREKNITLEE